MLFLFLRQIGCRIFYFLLPDRTKNVEVDSPSKFIRTIATALMASLHVRRLGYGIDGACLPYGNHADDEEAAQGAEVEKYIEEMATLQKVRCR